MDQIQNLIRLYKDQKIIDVMDDNELGAFFKSHGVPAFRKFLSLIPDNMKICVEDKEIEGLVNILNVLNCKTTASCSGHNNAMAFLNFRIEDMKDFRCVHRVLTDWSDGQLQEYFSDKFHISTLESGIRIDIDCSTDELDEFGAWIFFMSIHDIMLTLDWGWESKIIKELCQI